MVTFRLAGIPVSVHGSFLVLVFLGYGWGLRGAELISWGAAAFLAVLLHEAGHAFTVRRFGADGVAITLFAFGGATTYPASTDLTWRQRFLVAGAGSASGVLVGGLLWLAELNGFLDGLPTLLDILVRGFILASVYWGLLNWIPLQPLDGAHMVRSVLDGVAPKNAATIAKGISVVAGAAAVVVAVIFEEYFAAMFAVVLTVMSVRNPAGGGGGQANPTPTPEVASAEAEVERIEPEASDEEPRFPI